MRLNFWKTRFYPCPAEMKSLVPVLNSFPERLYYIGLSQSQNYWHLDWRSLSFVVCALHLRILAVSWLLPTRCQWHSFPHLWRPTVCPDSANVPWVVDKFPPIKGGLNQWLQAWFCIWIVYDTYWTQRGLFVDVVQELGIPVSSSFVVMLMFSDTDLETVVRPYTFLSAGAASGSHSNV